MAARKNKYGLKREDDLKARSTAVFGARRPGSFMAFGSDPTTGEIGQMVQGRLVGKGGDRLAGTGIGNEDVTAEMIRGGDLRKGIPLGRQPGPSDAVGRAAASMLARQAKPGPGMVTEKENLPMPAVPKPDLRLYPELMAFKQMQKDDPRKAERMLGANPNSASGKRMAVIRAQLQDYNQKMQGALDTESERQFKMGMEERKIAGREDLATLKGQTAEQKELDRQAKMDRLNQTALNRIAEKQAPGFGEDPNSPEYKQLLSDEYTKMAEESRLRREESQDEAEIKQLFEQENMLLRAAIERSQTEKTSREVVDPVTGEKVQLDTTKTRSGELPEATIGADTDGNGVPDADEEAMAWAKSNMKDNPIKAEAIVKRLKAKYPNIYGKQG